MKKLNALLVSILIFGASAAQAAGGHNAFIKSLGDIRSSVQVNPAGGQGMRFVPAEFRDPVENPFLKKLNESRRKVYQMALPAVLTVRAGSSMGSGFIVDPKGLVYTNYHVVAGAIDDVTVEMHDGKTYPAKVLAAGPGRDVVILQIEDDFKDWPALRMGEADTLTEGDIVFALGNPVGLGLSFSQGTVSRKRQGTVNYWVDFLQSDIQISQGNSGGPLLNHEGRIMGMNTAITGTGGRIGLAVRAEDLKASMQEYAKTGKLSDGYADFGMVETQGPDMEPTAAVNRIEPGSEAEKAGLKVGDAIVSYDGTPVRKGVKNQFKIFSRFGRKSPGETVTFEVMRGRKVKFRLGAAGGGVDAYLTGSEGIVILGEGNRHLLGPIMQFGAQAEVVLEPEPEAAAPAAEAAPKAAGGEAAAAAPAAPAGIALEVVTIAQDGSFAAFRIADPNKREAAAETTEYIKVAVEEFAPAKAE
ncbi:MAG: trypsin-like peptidase domain-containing protein [Elusimicrobiota bacterium]